MEKVDLQALEELDLLWSDAETHFEGVDVHEEEKFSQMLEEVFSKNTKNKIVNKFIETCDRDFEVDNGDSFRHFVTLPN